MQQHKWMGATTVAHVIGAAISGLCLLAAVGCPVAASVASADTQQGAVIVVNGPETPPRSATTAPVSVAPHHTAAREPGANPLRHVTDAIMADVGAGKLKDAYKLIGNYATAPPSDVHKQYAKLVKARKRRSYAATYGKTVGMVFAGQRELAGDLVELIYIERAQRRPLIWTFYGYHTAVGWGLVSWHVDSDIADAFKRLAR